jgi:hypothetical protein
VRYRGDEGRRRGKDDEISSGGASLNKVNIKILTIRIFLKYLLLVALFKLPCPMDSTKNRG